MRHFRENFAIAVVQHHEIMKLLPVVRRCDTSCKKKAVRGSDDGEMSRSESQFVRMTDENTYYSISRIVRYGMVRARMYSLLR